MNITVIVSKALNKENWKKGVNYLNKYGVKGFIRKLKHLSPDTDYNKWFLEQRVSDKLILEQANYKFEYEPEISITIPLYNTKREFLKDIMDSIVGQSYQKWELCLADGSKTDDVEKYLREHYLSDSRIKYKRLNKNLGIAGNTNTALNMASGEFIMLADHDDVLEKDALFEIVSLLNKNRKLDIVYTDEDLTNKNGTKYLSPRFKPDFNINFLRSINYICHIFLVRKTILDKVGGFRTEFDGAQDWDLILRCCEQTEYIGHVPKILYHWRAHEGSTAGNPASKKYAIAAGRKAVEEHYKRLGLEAKIEDTGIFVMFRTDFVVQNNPKISIIICNKDQKDTLNKCIDSILNKSTYNNYEIIIVENNSTEGETFQYYNEIQKKTDKVRVVYFDGEFNYSKVNNFGVQYATGEYILFLNNDTEVITEKWLEKMVGYCQLQKTGIVGAKLLYPDDSVQHCGVVIGVGGFAGHILTLSNRNEVGYFGKLQAVQNVSAVTGACLMIKRSVFEQVEGFDEGFKVALNDIDLCLKVRKSGYDVIIHPGVELYHYESKSRGLEETPEKHERFKREISRFRDRWKKELDEGDPFYNPNLTLMYGDCRIRETHEHFDIIDEIEAEKYNQ